MLTATVNDVTYKYFKSYEVQRSVEDLAGSFSLEISNKAGKVMPMQIGDSVQIRVNNYPILTGYIEKLKATYSDSEHTISMAGRDKVADFVDSTIGTKLELKAPITLEQIIKLVMKNINMTGVPIINNAGKLDAFNAGDLVSGQVDETIFEFLEKYTRKRQVLMTTDGNGGFVLARAGSKKAEGRLIHLLDDDRNNIIDASVEYDDTERFYEYRVHSQGNPTAGNNIGKSSNKELTNRIGIAYDPYIRKTRVLDITAESSTDSATLKKRAEWEANIRMARGFSYSATVYGHSGIEGGKPWEPNTKVSVSDDFALISESLIIKSVTYSLSVGEGSKTDLEMVDPDSYLPEPVVEKQKKGKKGRKRGRKSKVDGFIKSYNKYTDDRKRQELRDLNRSRGTRPNG